MELIVTLAYFFLVRFIFVDYKLIRWNMWWGILVFGIYSGAAMTEIVLLGQYAPYSDVVMVERHTVRVATYLGGQVSEVHVKPNQLIKKGDPLYSLDPAPIQDNLNKAKAELANAKIALEDAKVLVAKRVMAKEALPVKQDDYDAAQANVETYEYQLTQTSAYAPSDGYVVILQLQPGQFVRLKTPVMTFINTENAYLVMKVRQEGSQNIKPGQDVEFALSMYPGKVFKAKVSALVEGVGEAQFALSGQIPQVSSIHAPRYFFVLVDLDEEALNTPLVFGASGIAAINTEKGSDVFWLLRRIEIQSESILNYVFNPFRS